VPWRKHIRFVDPYNVKETMEIIKEELTGMTHQSLLPVMAHACSIEEKTEISISPFYCRYG
jgi:hypothetical protein